MATCRVCLQQTDVHHCDYCQREREKATDGTTDIYQADIYKCPLEKNNFSHCTTFRFVKLLSLNFSVWTLEIYLDGNDWGYRQPFSNWHQMWRLFLSVDRSHLGRGCRSGLIDRGLITVPRFSIGRFFGFHKTSLRRTGKSWLCKNTRQDWQLHWVCRRGTQDIWLWFVYVCCPWSPAPGQSLETCTCLCEWYEVMGLSAHIMWL